jgi:hypothetical protein
MVIQVPRCKTLHQFFKLLQYMQNASELLQWCSVCDPAKIFLTSKFSYLLFSNPTHKTKTGTPNRRETTNSTPPRPIIMFGLSETGSNSQIIFIMCQALLCLLPHSANYAKMLGQNHFAEPNWHVLTFLHPIFIWQDQILSTGGVALSQWSIFVSQSVLCAIGRQSTSTSHPTKKQTPQQKCTWKLDMHSCINEYYTFPWEAS